MHMHIVASAVNMMNSACRSATRSITLNLTDSASRLRYIHDMLYGIRWYPEHRYARHRVASRYIFHGRADGRPCSMYISIPPLRGMCGMILYAKSSLELIVNNRIGKVGIRPDGRPPSLPTSPPPARYHPVVHLPSHPSRSTLLTVSLPLSATHLI